MSADLRYETLPLVELKEEEEEDTPLIISGNRKISFGQSKWLSRWVTVLGLSEESSWIRPIALMATLVVWTVWQLIIQFWIGLQITVTEVPANDIITNTTQSAKQYTVRAFGNPVWPAVALFGCASYGFLAWYMLYQKHHYRSLITKQLQVEMRIEQDVERKIARNLYISIFVAVGFIISSLVKSIISGARYHSTGVVPYSTLQTLPVGVFFIHIAVEPLMMGLSFIAIFSCFLIMDVLGWVHAIDIRVYCSQVISIAMASNDPNFVFPMHQLIAQHQRIKKELSKTEKLWTPMILIAFFFGTGLVVTTLVVQKWQLNRFDVYTPVFIIPLFCVVTTLYLLNIAYVNKFGSSLNGQLYHAAVLKAPLQPQEVLSKIDFFENYVKRVPIQFTVLGLAVTYYKLAGFVFVLFELSSAYLIKSYQTAHAAVQ